jgi:hypothetical protein
MDSDNIPEGKSDFEIQRLVGSSILHPLVTEEVQEVCHSNQVRIEHNRVRNTTTDETSRAIRIVPRSSSHYVSMVVPVLFDGRFVLVGRYRYPSASWSLEFPRAVCRSRESGWKQVARRQLLKDAGLKPTKLDLLGSIQPDSSLSAMPTIVIVAEGCTQRKTPTANPRELIAGTIAASAEEFDLLVRRGEIACAVTLAALYLYRAKLRH